VSFTIHHKEKRTTSQEQVKKERKTKLENRKKEKEKVPSNGGPLRERKGKKKCRMAKCLDENCKKLVAVDCQPSRKKGDFPGLSSLREKKKTKGRGWIREKHIS